MPDDSGRARCRAKPMSRSWRVYYALFSLISGGCIATVETLDGTRHRISSTAFRDYAAAVFREQNRVASALAFSMEEPALGEQELTALEAAESQLLDACGSLNEIAVRRRDDARRRPFADARAAKTVPDCERAIDAANQTLAATTDQPIEGGRP